MVKLTLTHLLINKTWNEITDTSYNTPAKAEGRADPSTTARRSPGFEDSRHLLQVSARCEPSSAPSGGVERKSWQAAVSTLCE